MASLRLPSMLTSKGKNSEWQSLPGDYSSSAEMNPPGKTVLLTHDSSCFSVFPSDRSQSHSCQNWSYWRGSGAAEKEGPVMQHNGKQKQILHLISCTYSTFALSRRLLFERLFSLGFLYLFLECRWSFSSFSLAFTFSFSFSSVASIASLFSSSIPIPSSSISPSSSSPSSLKSKMTQFAYIQHVITEILTC